MLNITHTLDILDRLVSFDTTSHKTNMPLIAWVKSYLQDLGVSCQLQSDATGTKQNLIAQIGHGHGRGIVLSGHTDVVPAPSNDWTSDPFQLAQRDELLFGRGTTDMKGFLSNILASVPLMVEAELNRPITLALSYDEEVGCFGVPSLVSALPPQQDVIVGEPTKLQPGVRNKGALLQKLTVTGVAAHSGTPNLGVNAITHVQSTLAGLNAFGETLSKNDGAYSSNLVVTGIKGGGAANIVPDQCEVTWLFRPTNQNDVDRLNSVIQQLLFQTKQAILEESSRANVEVQTVCNVPPFSAKANFFKQDLYKSLFQDQDTVDLPFATEAGIFAKADHNVMVCGPGDMAQGHTVDEYISVADLVAGQKFIEDVIYAASA